MSINFNIPELRRIVVKHILRKAPEEHLLRQALCKTWHASTQLDEMAWTDYKHLFFNFPKLIAQLNLANKESLLSPGDYTIAFIGAVCHEILHILWMHGYRSKGKQQNIWDAACEYAINYHLCGYLGVGWIRHLQVMYPDEEMTERMYNRGLPLTTQGFYDFMLESTENDEVNYNLINVPCKFCERHAKAMPEKPDKHELLKGMALLDIAGHGNERQDIIDFVTSQRVVEQKVPWEGLLIGGLEDAIQQEQTWQVPSRRNELLPGWRREKLLSFVWILDISPSVDDDMKQSFMRTVQAGINRYHDATHRIIFFAENVKQDITVSSNTDLTTLKVPSGRGTDLTEVWEILEKDLPEYALVLTDLELGPVPKPSFTKIVWGIIGGYRMFDPDYGIKVQLN